MALMLDNCEGILLSLDSHKSVPAPFLTKTYQLVDDPSTDHIVSWGEDDTTFVVWRPPEFARDLLPNYFKHNNFSSFVRQLNTYGFRKIVPDRWEFANEFFKRGEKHLLCEIHRRKTAQPQSIPMNHHHSFNHHHQITGPGFFPNYPTYNRLSISPPDSDEQFLPQHHQQQHNVNWCDSPSSNNNANNNSNSTSTVTALSEDNDRLRRSNNMLMSELAHMRKLYNDIIYFVQNHVKPVTPSSSYNPCSLLPASATPIIQKNIHHQQQFSYQQITNPKNVLMGNSNTNNNVVSPSKTSQSSSVTILDEAAGGGAATTTTNGGDNRSTKLFGVPLMSKKRVHPEYSSTYYSTTNMVETNKARLMVLEKDDLGLNLMPPSSSS
ncbi:Heat stress transcription factor B-4 [Capsicum baccatum]|uniref:Heat stress transcription factor B-4 n=1 Tax=Capsicum baccatum TaxID=33114 RepID=A0A2G2VBY3_CAPBA|nr:Heat stress transcription factor B-4 [Capsicum baccatum]